MKWSGGKRNGNKGTGVEWSEVEWSEVEWSGVEWSAAERRGEERRGEEKYYLTRTGENETVELRGLNFMECSGQKLHVAVGNEMDWCGGN